MKHLSTLAASIFVLGLACTALPVLAADSRPVEQVIGACDAAAAKDPAGCGYSGDADGDISGCFAGGTCFFCPADGSRQCSLTQELKIGDRPKFRPDIVPPASLTAGSGEDSTPAAPAAPPPGGPILF